jgi:nucleoside-diphosphate-sugar epimerase
MHILSSNRRLLPVLLATGFLADQLATSHYFDISKARRELGYEPQISTEEGLEITLKSWKAA